MARKQFLSILMVVALVGSLTVAGSAAVVPTTEDVSTSSISGSVTVTVTSAADGDTVDVRYQNGSTDTVRLLGVDTPEVNVENTPGEFEGVPNTQAGKDCLRSAGKNASQFTKDTIVGETVTLKFDSKSDRRGDYGRLLAYVYVNGENFNLDLVEKGHARVYDSSFSQRQTFYSAENESQANLRGLWHCRTVDDGGSGGDDGSDSGTASVEWVYAEASSTNDERVQIKNTGSGELDLSGYALEDEAGHTYTFPDGFTLASGESVWVHSGSGTDDSDDLYAAFGHEIWNDYGDTAYLYDESGSEVDRRSY
ncbi:thermonuclease family protein [Halorussus gelatinilyticus]|uniref:Thermonuclease family protein n=1 Tax=Halorussus gelatinilyticus TaxID=2937524 RepID=A0A8U0ILP4_9EURY|nr:lamin tail domain-containing protein [Halorussus gelatinilyticus]UPW02063.1 thermonuclease family protein [Halorussus gelatinilyticus]